MEVSIIAVAIVLDEGALEIEDVRDREVQPFRPRRRDDVAASPARKSRPYRIGSATKLRNGAIDLSIDGPVTTCPMISGVCAS